MHINYKILCICMPLTLSASGDKEKQRSSVIARLVEVGAQVENQSKKRPLSSVEQEADTVGQQSKKAKFEFRCSFEGCGKVLASKNGIKNHERKVHNNAVSQPVVTQLALSQNLQNKTELEQQALKKVQAILASVVNKSTHDEEDRTPLVLAAIKNDLTTVRMLLSAGVVDVETVDKQGNNALHYATEYGYPEIMFELIASKANINAPDKRSGYTPLHKAAMQGKEKIVKLLLENGAQKDALGNNKTSPLILAAFAGHLPVVAQLIQANANKNIQDQIECTALHYAVNNNHQAVIKALIEAKAAMEIKNQYNVTALFMAVLANQINTVKLLLDAGASANCQDNSGNTSLDYALKANNYEMADLLVKSASPELIQKALESAIKKEDSKLVTSLLIAATGKTIKIPGNSIIKYLLNNNKLAYIPLVLQYGAPIARPFTDPAEVTEIGKLLAIDVSDTCLIWCALLDNARHAQILLEANFITKEDINRQDSMGMTALMWAAARGNSDIIQALLSWAKRTQNCDFITRTNKNGETALILAQKHNHKNIEMMISNFLKTLKSIDLTDDIEMVQAK